MANTTELSDRQRTIADFRFGIIADLVFSHLEKTELAKLIALKASQTWDIPFSRKKSITASCIRKWLQAFRACGKDGLVPKLRKDAGRCKVLSDTEKELIVQLLEKKPELCASTAVRMLEREGKLCKNISRSSLSRFLRSNGLGRAERRKSPVLEQVEPFAFQEPLECVQVDDMHSFAVPDHKGKLRKVILIAFLDDATRRVVYAHASFSENALEFERGIRSILATHGRIRQIYTDNGSTFIAEQTRIILASLGIRLVHSRPGIPKGRGKIERFFRTLRMQFEAALDPDTVSSIADYDQRLHTWLEREYHRTPHSGLGGKTPLEAWISGTKYIIRMEPGINLDEVFCHQYVRRVANDATVSLEGTQYEVPSVLIKEKVTLLTNPQAQVPSVRIVFDGKDYGTARRVDEYANARSRRMMADSEPAQASLRLSSAINPGDTL